jgi:hypothetical protein
MLSNSPESSLRPEVENMERGERGSEKARKPESEKFSQFSQSSQSSTRRQKFLTPSSGVQNWFCLLLQNKFCTPDGQ